MESESIGKVVGARIKAARKKAGLKQCEVATKLGIVPAGVGLWETGKRTPTLETLYRLSDAIECDIGDLLPEGVMQPTATTSFEAWQHLEGFAISLAETLSHIRWLFDCVERMCKEALGGDGN